MKKKKAFFCAIIILLIFSSCGSTRIYIVRHAEKSMDIKNDPPLTAEGKQRAILLSELLRNRKIEKFYSTETIRTISTAKPLADIMNRPIEFYSNDTLPKFIYRVLEDASNTLIVGHSNTILKVLMELELSPSITEVADNEYDKLFIVSLHSRDGLGGYRLSLKETSYGKPANTSKKK